MHMKLPFDVILCFSIMLFFVFFFNHIIHVLLVTRNDILPIALI